MGRYPHLDVLVVEGKRALGLAEQAMEFTEVIHLAGVVWVNSAAASDSGS